MKTFFVAVLAVVGMLVLIDDARATLGEGSSSVESDRAALMGKRKSPSLYANYRVEELAVSGAEVREYISNDSGIVFGIAWSGHAHPDLTFLLGAHLQEYKQTAHQNPRVLGQRSHRTIAGQNLVVATWGHMRALGGQAYLPALLPEGVSANEIR